MEVGHNTRSTDDLATECLEPERESWHRALMRLYARSGDRALALRQYHACRALLRRDLGIEPGPGTRALYEEILRDEQSIGERAEVGARRHSLSR